jgi:AcrR family transcriptional regulator
MSPRPRTVSDEEILGATHRVISRRGPATFTLADVATEVGLSPATLVQRFGSKRGLLLALCSLGVSGVDACFAAMRAAHPSPIAALIAAATDMTRYVTTPEELANSLAFLQLDVSDPEFHRISLQSQQLILDGYRALLDDAIAAGELTPCDTGRLARALGAIVGGSLIGWAIFREGTAEQWVRDDLDMLLAPYLRRANGNGRKRSATARRQRPRGSTPSPSKKSR